MNSTRAIVIATDLGATGEAVFRFEGRVGFVAGLLPGESGEVQIDVLGGIWRGRLLRRLSDAPERITHPCPHAAHCPASRLGCLTRESELFYKKQHAEATLQRIGGIDRKIADIVTAGPEWRYRNKIEVSIADRSGQIIIGYHPSNDSSRIIGINDCLLADEAVRQLLQAIIGQAKSTLRPVLQNTRRLSLRSGDGLHLHLTTHESLNSNHNDRLQGFFREYTGLVGITTAPLLNDKELVSGKTVTQTIAGELLLTGHDGVLTHPLTFRQVNDSVARALVGAVEEWCNDVVGIVFDLYSGYGPFARRIATVYGNEIYALELSDTAVRDGQRALKKKPLPVTYHRCDVGKGFPTIAPDIRPEAILLDPPHRGAGEPIIKEILRRKPRKIGYIACHGAALARDLKPLLMAGYHLDRVRLFDMFPRTPEIEWFAELERQ